MSDPVRSPSSIPIPDELVHHAPSLHPARFGKSTDKPVIRVVDLPKLYAHWAEQLRGKLDELRLHDDTGDPRDEGYMACLADVSAALGLEDRT